MTEQNQNTQALAEAGVSIWLDDLSRHRITSGNLQELIQTRSVTGVTTNPSIFAAALKDGGPYREQLQQLAREGADVERAVFELTTRDVREACDVFAPVHQQTDGVDGRVSIEVDPRSAREAEATVSEARELAAGHALKDIHSVASFFVSRVDTEVDRRLDASSSPGAGDLRGLAGLANARLAYRIFTDTLDTERWRLLADAGARPQRPLWASTGTKDPALPDTLYVTGLVAPGTVNTMPEKTLEALADHGVVQGDTISSAYETSDRILDSVGHAGVDYQDVVRTLEDEGLQKFVDSWQELLQTVRTALDQHRSTT